MGTSKESCVLAAIMMDAPGAPSFGSKREKVNATAQLALELEKSRRKR